MMEKKTFEENMTRLDEIVERLERNDTPLDETITYFEEGLKLVNELEKRLKGYEAKVEELLKASEKND